MFKKKIKIIKHLDDEIKKLKENINNLKKQNEILKLNIQR